jgi:hypothetical protein
MKVIEAKAFIEMRLTSSAAASFNAPLRLVAPGGGLKQLDFFLDNTDFIFDTIFSAHADSLDSGYETSEYASTISEIDQPKSYIRVYQTDEDM